MSHWRKRAVFLHIVLVECIVVPHVLVLSMVNLPREYKFISGHEEAVTFYHTLKSDDSSFSFEIYATEVSSKVEFCENGTINSQGLAPGQTDRFSVHVNRAGSNIRIKIAITAVQNMDKGVYVLAIHEDNAAYAQINSLYTAIVKVITLVEKAKCWVEILPKAYNACIVRCNATLHVTNIDDGSLRCFENSQEAHRIMHPFRPTDKTSVLTASFLTECGPNEQIRCCSFETAFGKDIGTCNDFIYSLRGNADATLSPNFRSQGWETSESTQQRDNALRPKTKTGKSKLICHISILQALYLILMSSPAAQLKWKDHQRI